MKIGAFRRLLMKKADTQPTLMKYANNASDEFLADMMIQALKRLTSLSKARPRGNTTVGKFTDSLDTTPTHEGNMVPMVRDALGHHVSHYKAALKKVKESQDAKHTGNENAFQKIADGHARHAMKILHLMSKVDSHASNSFDLSDPMAKKKVNLTAINPSPWERHDKETKPGSKSTFSDSNGFGNWNKASAKRGLKYLQYPPHSGHKGSAAVINQGHKGAYPFEHVQINGKHIHVDDNVELDLDSYKFKNPETRDQIAHIGNGQYGVKLHAFDHHPIMEHFFQSLGKHTEEHKDQYDQHLKEWEGSDHIKNYFDTLDAAEQADPEAFASRGSKPSDPVHSETLPAPLSQKEAEAYKQQDIQQKITQSPEQRMQTRKQMAERLRADKEKQKKPAEQPAINKDLIPAGLRHLVDKKDGEK